MVSAPNNNNPAVAGFISAAADTAEDSVEEKSGKSYLRELAAMCAALLEKMRKSFQTQNVAVDESALKGNDPTKAFWFRKHMGKDVYDCGNRFHISGTNKEPVTKKQLEIMIQESVNRKDPPWETIYMFDRKGKPDLQMAGHVQSVINEMRQSGRIPPECKISCCTDPARYPENIKSFFKNLKSDFAGHAENPAATPAAQGGGRPGFQAAPV